MCMVTMRSVYIGRELLALPRPFLMYYGKPRVIVVSNTTTIEQLILVGYRIEPYLVVTLALLFAPTKTDFCRRLPVPRCP